MVGYFCCIGALKPSWLYVQSRGYGLREGGNFAPPPRSSNICTEEGSLELSQEVWELNWFNFFELMGAWFPGAGTLCISHAICWEAGSQLSCSFPCTLDLFLGV